MTIMPTLEHIKRAIETFDQTSTASIQKEERGLRLSQRLSDGSAGVMLFFTEEENTVVFNHGWKMDKGYLGNIADMLIRKLNELGLMPSIDGLTLFHVSHDFKNAYALEPGGKVTIKAIE